MALLSARRRRMHLLLDACACIFCLMHARVSAHAQAHASGGMRLRILYTQGACAWQICSGACVWVRLYIRRMHLRHDAGARLSSGMRNYILGACAPSAQAHAPSAMMQARASAQAYLGMRLICRRVPQQSAGACFICRRMPPEACG